MWVDTPSRACGGSHVSLTERSTTSHRLVVWLAQVAALFTLTACAADEPTLGLGQPCSPRTTSFAEARRARVGLIDDVACPSRLCAYRKEQDCSGGEPCIDLPVVTFCTYGCPVRFVDGRGTDEGNRCDDGYACSWFGGPEWACDTEVREGILERVPDGGVLDSGP